MSSRTIFRLEAAPGDKPRALEQPNGDLLIPAEARETIALALQQVELSLALSHKPYLGALADLRTMLNAQPRPKAEDPVVRNLMRLSPI